MYKLKVFEMRKIVNKMSLDFIIKRFWSFFIFGGEGGDSYMWCNVLRLYVNYE